MIFEKKAMIFQITSYDFFIYSRIFEDAAKEVKAEKKATAKKAAKKEEAPMIQNQAASTTLGDIDALAALKEQMEANKK